MRRVAVRPDEATVAAGEDVSCLDDVTFGATTTRSLHVLEQVYPETGLPARLVWAFGLYLWVPVLFLFPSSRRQILVGKNLTYFTALSLVNLAFVLVLTGFSNGGDEAQTMGCAEAVKHQAPSTKLQKNFKRQAPKRTRAGLFKIWSLELLWCLEFGVWDFICVSFNAWAA